MGAQVRADRSQRLGHMIGASWFFVALARHAREHGGGELIAWLSEQELTARLYQHHHPQKDGTTPHPDGLGIWAEDGRDIVFLLEYDTGSEHLPQLADKLPGYADHARRDPALTLKAPILFCFPTPRREQTARKALAAATASRDLQVATAALDPRLTCPACEPAWMPLHGGHRPMRLIDLADTYCPTPGAPPASKPNGNAASKRAARWTRTAYDPTRFPQRPHRRLGWRFRRRLTSVGGNASRRSTDSAGQRRNVPARQQTRLAERKAD